MVNLLFKLDLLEAYYLNKKTRFQKSKLILKSKKNHKLIPLNLKKLEQELLIKSTKIEIFQHKLHYSLIKYQRELKKLIKSLKVSKKITNKELEFLQSLNLERISKIRVLKIILKVFNLKKDEFIFIEEWISEAINNKSNFLNPTKFYNDLTNEQRNWYSKLMNDKGFKSLNEQIELSLKLILGPIEQATKKKQIEMEKLSNEKDKTNESYIDSDNDFDSNDKNNELKDIEGQEISDEEDYSQYDSLVVASDNDDDDDDDNIIDYNQITDEEPSENEVNEIELKSESEDDFFEESKLKKKEKKIKKKEQKLSKLPKLMQGYISAENGSESENDQVVESILKPQRNNRRGQRARQKIWEQKYGVKANHIKKEWENKKLEREKKQKEWEERERKRQINKMNNGSFASGENMKPLGIRGNATINVVLSDSIPTVTSIHPSWEAKLKQKEVLKNVKFIGKKLKFD